MLGPRRGGSPWRSLASKELLLSRLALARSLGAATAASLALAVGASPASAFTYVTDSNGTAWGVQDAAPPRVDTGSIRATQVGTGVLAPYSTMLNGYGGIRVRVDTTPAPAFNGALMRGFGLTFDGTDHFDTTTSVDLGGVRISRSVYLDQSSNWGRWLDTFTNTTKAPITVDVAFGGQTGYGSSGTNQSQIVATSSGDTAVTPADSWAEVASGTAPTGTTGGPSAVVIGDPDPFGGALNRAGNWLRQTFDTPLATDGHEANYQAYVNTLTLQPRHSRSLVHFVVAGKPVTATTSAAEIAAVGNQASALATSPALGDLSTAQICSIANVDVSSRSIPGFDPAECKQAGRVEQPRAPRPNTMVTTSSYDVVDKTIEQMQADMEAGKTTSQEITRAYLDRIAAYDTGQFGFNAYTTVAGDAMQQARKADQARKGGRRGALLGIPIAFKDLYDTKDMPTTNGSLTFQGFRPANDAYQVAQIRAAGAVVIGKASMEQYATSGSYSDSAFGQVWNAFDPSKSALASSGGSAVATALSLAGAAFGSQTGDSLYAPASAASLVTLRGTDGMESDRGVMPLRWLQDYAGVLTRSVSDLADILNVVSGTDPQNPETADASAHRPADWRSVLDPNALKGKRIGLLPSAWVDPYGTTGTVDAEKAALKYLQDAGAQIVDLSAGPTVPATVGGDANWEGWARYIASHPELPLRSPADIVCSQKKLPYTRYAPSYCDGKVQMTPAEVQAWRDYRAQYKANIGAWMDANNVDAVVYPGLLSDISLNDGGGNRSSFGRRDTPSGSSGAPTVAFPAGVNDHGEPVGLQFLGRAWDDAKIVGMAYAFEQLAHGHVAPSTAPALPSSQGQNHQSGN
jgi:amidase